MQKQNIIKYKIGIDEAGRGPWLGSVVACALAFNPENMPESILLSQINDSKKLSEKKREELFEKLIDISRGTNPSLYFGVGVVDNYIIDEINIKQANKEAMRRALVELERKIDFKNLNGVFIDGNDNYKFDILEKPPIFIVEGDSKVTEIGAASIIAKVFRDKLMNQYALLYPDLNLENHKGYGTKNHSDYLTDKSKITGIHRLSYKPVKKILEQKPKLLLHICCGPDATVPIMDLKNDYEVICFWYDPNIQPKKEHDKRLGELIKVCEIEKVEYIVGEYDYKNFFDRIKGFEDTPEKGEKCTHCYDMRLERTALEARRLGIKYWTSTLNTSPHKDLEKMFSLGDKWSINETFDSISNKNLKEKLDFLKTAFRKNAGFKRSVEYTKKHNIYRQTYCGCIYSDTFPGKNNNKKSGFSG
ncbi:ribonuclease HII [Candidatus Gracilibacteria bacterium]|nr:ribonuclease HII [Candidatus Gracilibacteria bacterium]